MTEGVSVRTRHGWMPLAGGGPPPRVLETDDIVIRGLVPADRIRVGLSELTADPSGVVSLRPATDEHLSGHVGLVEVATADDRLLAEIELVPDKLSEHAYMRLRADLQRVWTDLVLDPDGLTTTRAAPPSARQLWRRIDQQITRILEHPSERLQVGTAVRRMEQVKRRRELRPNVVRAGALGRPALTRTLERTTDTPENGLCAATLQLLRNHARRDPDADDIVRRVDGLLRQGMFADRYQPVRRVTWGMRSDQRYRQVLAVHQILNRPELAATEGPGELRLGIPALARLYEYWVFLQVLLAAHEVYGPPMDSGFEALAVRLPGRRRRLEVPRGTTITFPGPVHVAFEPAINTRGDGWMGLEYVPHPDIRRQQLVATPDVMLFCPGDVPWAIVIDAKYVGRSFVESEAAKVHEKYARMRWNGSPVVRNVLVGHPHAGLSRQWAGYGHTTMAPGEPTSELALPRSSRAGNGDADDSRTVVLQGPRAVDRRDADAASGQAPTAVSIVADQFWMHDWLQGRRIDLGAMRAVVAAGRSVTQCEIVMPRLAQLVSFAHAAEHRGWLVHWVDSTERKVQLSSLVELAVRRLADGPVVVVTGDPAVASRLPVDQVEVFSDLDSVPLL